MRGDAKCAIMARAGLIANMDGIVPEFANVCHGVLSAECWGHGPARELQAVGARPRQRLEARGANRARKNSAMSRCWLGCLHPSRMPATPCALPGPRSGALQSMIPHPGILI